MTSDEVPRLSIVSLRSQSDYDKSVPIKYQNGIAEPWFPTSKGSVYKFPSFNHRAWLVACLYERCDLDWVPEIIIGHEWRGSEIRFHVRWLGLEDDASTWETVDLLAGSPELVQSYCAGHSGNEKIFVLLNIADILCRSYSFNGR
jgi:hypothetical protein